MTVELTLLAWTALLGLAQILIAGAAKRRVDGAAWALGSRDIQPPTYPPIAQRLQRAQDNLFETLPLFAIAVLAAAIGHRTGPLTSLGAQLYFWGRVAYLPLYASGIAYLRTVAWGISLVGLLISLGACLVPA